MLANVKIRSNYKIIKKMMITEKVSVCVFIYSKYANITYLGWFCLSSDLSVIELQRNGNVLGACYL